MILGATDIILSIIILTVFGLLIYFSFIFFKKEFKKMKKDKYLSVNDFDKEEKVINLLKYRIENKKNQELYFNLMLVSIDQFSQIKEYFPEGIKEYTYKLITYIRMNLPKGSKMCQLQNNDFLIYLPEIMEEKALFKLAEEIKHSIEKRVLVQKTNFIKKNASIALAYYPQDGDNLDLILKNIKNTLINVKKLGGNAIALYQKESNKEDNYYQSYINLQNSLLNKDIYVESKDIYDINKKIGSSSYLYYKYTDKTLNYHDMIDILNKYNDNLWVNLFYFERTIENNINTLRELGSKPYYFIFQTNAKLLENNDLYSNYIDIINKYKLDASKFYLEIMDYKLINKDSNNFKNLLNIQELGFNYLIEIKNNEEKTDEIINLLNINLLKVKKENINLVKYKDKEILVVDNNNEILINNISQLQ